MKKGSYAILISLISMALLFATSCNRIFKSSKIENLTQNIGEYYNDIKDKDSSLEPSYVGGPNCAYVIMENNDNSLSYIFYGTQGGPEGAEVFAICGDRLKCCGVYTSVENMFSIIEAEALSVEEFIKSVGKVYDNPNDVTYWWGWIFFEYEGYSIQIYTGYQGDKGEEIPKVKIEKGMRAIIINDTTLKDNNALINEVARFDVPLINAGISEDPNTIDINDGKYTIQLNIPKFSTEDSQDEDINNLLKDTISNYLLELFDGNLADIELNLDYKVKYYADNCISLLFNGDYYNSTSEYPCDLLFGVNVDLGKKSIIPLNEKFKVDDSFEEMFEKEVEKNYPTTKLKYISETYCGKYLTNFINSNVFNYYLADDMLYLILPIEDLAGNYYVVPMQQNLFS